MIEKPRYLTPTIDSNDWLGPIGESAKAVFAGFSRDDAIDIAGALVKSTQGLERNEIPWTIVFSSDNFELVSKRLEAVLGTPDGETPTHNPKYFAPIRDLKKILFDAGVVYPFYGHAANSLIPVAAGKAGSWVFYDDFARRYPQFIGSWKENLIEQFGEETVFQAIHNKDGPFNLFRRSETLALLLDDSTTLRKELTSLNVIDAGDMETATEPLDVRLGGYRKIAYRLRGIPFWKDDRIP